MDGEEHWPSQSWNILVRCMEPISLPKAMWRPLYHWPARGPKSGSMKNTGRASRRRRSQQQLLVLSWVPCRRSDPLYANTLEEVEFILKEYGAKPVDLAGALIWMKEEEIESGIYDVHQGILGWVGPSWCLANAPSRPITHWTITRHVISSTNCPNVTTLITAPTAVLSWLTLPSPIWKRCSWRSRKSHQFDGMGKYKQTIKEDYVMNTLKES